MSAQPILPQYTTDQYFAMDSESNIRLEYDRGYVYAMADADEDHIVIASQINGFFVARIQDKPCFSYQSDLKVGLPNEAYFYPDVVVACGKRDFEMRPKGVVVLLNPLLIVEILSTSTAIMDRTRKYDVYTAIPSLQHYLIVAQETAHITHHARTANGWTSAEYRDLTDELDLGDLGHMSLAWAYAKVSW